MCSLCYPEDFFSGLFMIQGGKLSYKINQQ